MSSFNTFSKQNFNAICDELSLMDQDLGAIIESSGYPPMWVRPNTFETLVHLILEQQVSLASARAALNRLKEKTGNITTSAILVLSDEELRNCYVSRQKTGYIRGIAQAIENERLDLNLLGHLSDEDVRRELIKFKGIGDWTVDVYLMFVLQRTDVFPIGDVALVHAIKRTKQLLKDADKKQILDLAESWRPYRSVATMILWHHYLSLPIKRTRQAPKSKRST